MAMHQVNDPEVYYVELEVISGNDLPSRDIGGKSDPFVKLTVGDEERQTKVIKKSLNPEWNTKFNFKFFENPKSIKFEVLDKDLTSNDKVGSAEFDLTEMFQSKTVKPFSGTLPLKHKHKAQGTLTVMICAQKLLPLNARKLTVKQQETLKAQSQQIESLGMQIGTLRQQNASLQRQVESAEHPGSGMAAAAASAGQSYSSRPTRRQEAIEGANRFVELAMAKMLVIRLLMTKVVAMWQWVLRKCIYDLPVIGYYADLFVLFLGSVLRLEVGHSVLAGATSSKRPSRTLKVYEFEGDVECKMVRETLSALDLDCVVYPCPPGRDEYLSRFIGDAKELSGGGAVTFPMVIDENFEDGPLVLSGSEQTIKYLMDQYGNNVKMTGLDRVRYAASRHWLLVAAWKVLYQGLLRSLPEHGNERKGTTVKPKELLELWSYEASPFCTKVKEVLSALELPYVVKNVAAGSKQKRQEFKIRFGKKYPSWRQKLHFIQVPLLIDPNTGREVFESEDIKNYLINEYCTQSTA